MRLCTWVLETSDFKPNRAILLCAGIKEIGKDATMIFNKRLPSTNDKDIVIETRDELEKYDLLIGFYTLGFDLKFLNSRLMYWNKRPLDRRLHLDVYRVAKTLFNTSSRSLGALTQFLNIPGKNHVDFTFWQSAVMEGDKKAMKYIIEHCRLDLEILEQLHNRIKRQIKSISLA